MNTVSAADDAAGVAIASRLTAEIRGTNQAIRNAMDAQALIDTAEGAHSEVEFLLQRMRELAVQAANDTNNADDRTALQTEFDQLVTEIDRIATVTTWADQNLLNATGGTSGTFTFQVGARTNAADKIEVAITDIGSSTLAVSALSLASNSSANTAITAIDTAIGTVNSQRSDLGAYSNRLDSTVRNLTNIVTNLQAGRGRVEDADFASETTNLAKTQILQQASMAMLAQANASKQGVLSLLQR
jgi:flagellin